MARPTSPHEDVSYLRLLHTEQISLGCLEGYVSGRQYEPQIPATEYPCTQLSQELVQHDKRRDGLIEECGFLFHSTLTTVAWV
jgi:hypothetical protein